jgi:hypothetical protein
MRKTALLFLQFYIPAAKKKLLKRPTVGGDYRAKLQVVATKNLIFERNFNCLSPKPLRPPSPPAKALFSAQTRKFVQLWRDPMIGE